MKNINKISCWGLLSLILLSSLSIQHTSAQERILIHSHNDYRQRVPFYQAYAQQVYSIEVDLFAKGKNQLLVGHDLEDLSDDATFDDIYLNPLVKLFKQNGGRPWKDSDYLLQLMIELKSPTEPTLSIVVDKLKAHPQVFNPEVNPNAVRIVITGNVPKAEDFEKYPPYISFDGQIDANYTPQQLKRVALISPPFHEYAKWNGKGTLKRDEVIRVQAVIDKAHSLGKPIRFWGTPNSITAWNTLHNMGVDIINTDKVEACADFFHNFEDKNYQIAGTNKEVVGGVTKTDRLDKTTSGFQGFDHKKQQLSKGIDVYMPTYKNDGENKPVKNIIFLIGDGMGLAQINVAETVNNGLTVLNMNHIGLQKNSSKDAYTTDSAAGGSALATGQANSNRHISMSDEGIPYRSMTDVAYDAGLACGVVTWGNLADATPAAYYGHSTERDNADEITNWLLDGKLTLLNGSGMEIFTDRKDSKEFLEKLQKTYRLSTSIDDINKADDKVVCVDSRMDLAAEEETLGLLAQATREAIEKLTKTNNKGFFLMVEGAKIDYAGHANSLPGSVVEMLSFDLAIQEALKFADSNGETLVVVTADHETGGLTLVDGDRKTGHITARYMTDDHTPIMLPVFAYGPGAAKFGGVYKNTDIFHKMKSLLIK